MRVIDLDRVHATAIVSDEADLAPDVTVGPYAVITGPVAIGPGSVVEAHAVLEGPLEMGPDNHVFSGAVLGRGPQHRGDKGEGSGVRIGAGNVFREGVTVHRGTEAGGGLTRIGDLNYFMVGSHVGHDSRVGDRCTLVNHALVAGHCVLDEGCVLSGHAAIQQRVRVGRLAMLSGMGSSTKDVPPFVLQQGYNCVSGLNLVGMRRAGISSRAIDAMRNAFRIVYREGLTVPAALERAEEELGGVAEVREFVAFVRGSRLGINLAHRERPERRV